MYQPPERYVRVEAARGTSSTLGDIWAIQYNGRRKPITQNITGTIVGKAIGGSGLVEGTK